MKELLAFPDRLWDMALFRDSARFGAPAAPLAVLQIEAGLRRIRRMPSAADETNSALIQAVDRVGELGEKWLGAGALNTDPGQCGLLLSRIKRLESLVSRGFSSEAADAALAGIRHVLPPPLIDGLPVAGADGLEFKTGLDVLRLRVIDHFARESPGVRRRYLKAAHKAADNALAYNTTTDAPRQAPALLWIRQTLQAMGRRGCVYADVGCGAAGGAPALKLAAKILKPDGLCREIHGTDAPPISRVLAMEMLRGHGVKLYGSRPLSRPLPEKYDALLLANVNRHLTLELQKDLLTNLGLSLNANGLLFVCWRFKEGDTPGVCLERAGVAMRIAQEARL